MTLVQSDAACSSCHGCAQSQEQQIQIPGLYSHEVELHLSLKDQVYALFHSLLLPLGLAMGLAFIAETVLSSEIYGIISAVCGFSIGMLLCRQLRPSALRVKEV